MGDHEEMLSVIFELDKHHEAKNKKDKGFLLTETRMNEIWSYLKDRKVKNVIIIIQGDLDKKAKTLVDAINALHTFNCQVFNFDDLVFDITKHELVSEHIPISDEEKKVQYF